MCFSLSPAEEKRADARSYFWFVFGEEEGWVGGGVFFSGKSFCLNLVPVKSRRASRQLGFGLLCSSQITEFYFFYSLPVFSSITEDKEIIILSVRALNLKL